MPITMLFSCACVVRIVSQAPERKRESVSGSLDSTSNETLKALVSDLTKKNNKLEHVRCLNIYSIVFFYVTFIFHQPPICTRTTQKSKLFALNFKTSLRYCINSYQSGIGQMMQRDNQGVCITINDLL